MKKIALSFLLCFLFSNNFGQNQEADSLISLIEKTEGQKKAILLEDISIAYRFTDTKKSIKYAKEALIQARLIKDSIEIGNSFNCIGISNHIQGNYDIALTNYLQALKAFESKSNNRGIASTSLNIGILYADQQKYDQALTYYKEALSLYEAGAGQKRDIANALNNISTIYSSQENFPKALEYQNKALQIRKEIQDSAGISTSLGNIAIIYYGTKKFDSALFFHQQSLEIHKSMNNPRSIALVESNIAEVYFQLKDYKNVIKYSEECIQIARKNDLKPQLKQAYLVLSDAYKLSGNYIKALEYQELYANIKDTIYSEEAAQSIAEMQTKYDSEKKENDNNILRQEAEIKNLQLSKNKTWIAILFLGIGFAVILALFLYNRYRQKNKDNLLLEQKNAEITIQKQEITDSINYAKKIQNAILPPASMVKKILPDSFILYKPKDIVSGDFYWIEQKENTILFAAVDCTGHGVPGAMMSVLGYNLLSQAVNEKDLTTPSSILKHLDVGVNQMLRQATEENAMKDGMDLALCSINTSTLQLDYAGAYNPLWIIKNDTSELIEIKGDKKPIGANISGDAGKFTNHKLQLQKGDCIYIFSDGYADQFGGTKGKKFMYGSIKKLLVSIHSKPMQEQLSILEKTFHEWQGNLEQVDDVIVIGVRV